MSVFPAASLEESTYDIDAWHINREYSDNASDEALAEEQRFEEAFRSLANQWRHETRNCSIRRAAMHPAYRSIVAMQNPVVPLIIAELQRQPDHWFWALHEITGATPVRKEDEGNIKAMARAWIEWFQGRDESEWL